MRAFWKKGVYSIYDLVSTFIRQLTDFVFDINKRKDKLVCQ